VGLRSDEEPKKSAAECSRHFGKRVRRGSVYDFRRDDAEPTTTTTRRLTGLRRESRLGAEFHGDAGGGGGNVVQPRGVAADTR